MAYWHFSCVVTFILQVVASIKTLQHCDGCLRQAENYPSSALWYHTANGGSAVVLTELTLHFCAVLFFLSNPIMDNQRGWDIVYLPQSHSLSEITLSFTRAIEIRGPDKDPLMVFGAEIGTTLRWAPRWTGSFLLPALSGIDSFISSLWPWVDSSIRAVSVGQLGFCYN